jgi:hypothetical protein
MNKIRKVFGGLTVVAGAILVAWKKFVLVAKAATVVLIMLHLATDTDSTAVAARHLGGKPVHQVAQGSSQKQSAVEKLAGPVAPAPSSGPALLPSAPLGAGAIQAARNAAAAQNNQLASETGQTVPTPRGAAAAPPTPAPQTPTPAPPQTGQVVQQGAAKPVAVTNSNSVEAVVMRESFDYTRDTRRDPFVSLMTTSDLRPTLTDLRLTGILYDLSGRRPVAILRDIAGGQWRVTTGMTLGRMRVAQIKPKTIIFTIEEFGFNRQDSLILGDTTRVRHR